MSGRAASAHIAKGKGRDYLVQGRLSPEQQARARTQLDAVHPMGRVFTEDARNRAQTYILGFVSREGTTQRTVMRTATALALPQRTAWRAGSPPSVAYAFLDLQPLRAQQAGRAPEYFAMQGLRRKPLYADWPQFFDGLFYMRTPMRSPPSK